MNDMNIMNYDYETSFDIKFTRISETSVFFLTFKQSAYNYVKLCFGMKSFCTKIFDMRVWDLCVVFWRCFESFWWVGSYSFLSHYV